MKKLALTLLTTVAIIFSVYAQNNTSWSTNGNIGIGTTNPQALLHVFGSNAILWGLTLGLGTNNAIITTDDNSKPITFQIAGNEMMRVNNNGNIGIGTNNPESKLQIFSPLDGSISPVIIGNGNDPGNINVPVGSATGGYNIDFKSWRDVAPDQVCARIRAERINDYQPNNALIQAMDLAFYTSYGVDQSQLTEKMRVKFNGNVGIGTSNPDQKLTVNGTIHSSEVKVDTQIPVPDYVFEPSYQLADLPSVNEYVIKYHHLPEIPSAEQIQKDGLKLGEMNTLLLKKVEELTLYLIQKDHEVNQLNTEIKQLKKQSEADCRQQDKINELEEKVNKLLSIANKTQ